MKVKRAQVMKDFESVIADMYAAPRPARTEPSGQH
jgi:long-chain acyl-CoA synthetase